MPSWRKATDKDNIRSMCMEDCQKKLKELLDILLVEYQTKEKQGFTSYAKSWRVRVENIFKEYICRPEAIPLG